MGVHFSCPFTAYCDLENTIESASVKSNGCGDEEAKNPVRSISYKIRHSEPTMMQPKASLKTTETITRVSVEAPLSKENDMLTTSSDGVEGKERDYEIRRSDRQLPILDLSNEAAIKLQKVYKSFRTRRKLADGAVLIEQSWWKLLDFAELKRSSISFFEIEKHETAISRWSRARTKAAKVGKGLSKNSKAQKLALQHWLEAIDPRHRYGHNLHFYYIKWLHSQSKEPFFYWLDIGEGKEVNLVEKCPRLELHQQCIKYLGPMERKAYEVIVEDGKLLYKQSRLLVDTNGEPNGAKWIFVLSTSMNLYVGQKKKGSFQHSSFLAGGATSAAGRIVIENGNLKAVWPHSGHYRPTPENFQDFITFLKGNNMDLTNVKMESMHEEEGEYLGTQNSVVLRSISSEEDLSEKTNSETDQMDGQDKSLAKTNSAAEEEEEEEEDHASKQSPQLLPPGSLHGKLPNLLIPDRDDLFEELKFENQLVESSTGILGAKSSPLDGYETAEDRMISEHYFSDEDGETKESIPEEWILKRIDSHKRMNSFQLGKQLSCKWTTGAGPRIGCLRDYPSKLQCHALEQVNLSPRIAGCFRSKSTRESIPNSYLGEMHIRKTSYSGELPRIRYLTPQSSPLLKGASATRASAK